MLAKDVMTTAILTVTPDTDVGDIARTLLEAHISADPGDCRLTARWSASSARAT
jgi:CBS domain-containing protein